MEISQLLKLMLEHKASDLFITTGIKPAMKVQGRLVSVGDNALSPDDTREAVFSVMNEKQKNEFNDTLECNFAISAKNLGRFRVSAFFQRNQPGMVIRRIETQIPQLDELNMPVILKDLILLKKGLILYVGGTGAGKSTSLAAMIGHRNKETKGHIISIEDPIEFVHQHQNCVITQREVGIDTESFEVALKNTLRQAPDVVMIGEIRSRETMEYALTFAETGHLCLATLHANNANQTLDRIANFFPSERRSQLWMDLSLNLRGIIAQQLIPTKDKQSRQAAVEVLLNTPLMSDLIRKGDIQEMKSLMNRSREQGMQTFDHALMDLYRRDLIEYEEALKHADSANDLRLMIKLDADKKKEVANNKFNLNLNNHNANPNNTDSPSKSSFNFNEKNLELMTLKS